MRILYFHNYINKNATTEIQLQNCNLVIDALTFCYYNYAASGAASTFGFEADTYAKRLITVYDMFVKAGIKCHFVFDGGDDDKNKQIQRLQNSIHLKRNSMSPVFLTDVCLQVLKDYEDLGIKFATIIIKGKDDCTTYLSLARKLNCPILSNAVQFCFKSSPYIPLNTFKIVNGQIICRQYELKNFLSQHKLTENKAAIFAALSDLKSFPRFYFNNLLSKWNIFHEQNCVNHKDLLKWLSNHSVDEIINDVHKFLSNGININKFYNYVDDILEDIQDDDYESILADYLHKDLNLTVTDQDPLWFEKGVATQQIAFPYIDLCQIKLIRGARFLGTNDHTDSIMLSIDIIKYAYNLLMNYERNGSFTLLQPAGDPVEINTEDLNIKKPKYECDVSVFENGWADIKQLKLFEHFLIENKINIDKIEEVPRDARMLLITLAYFTRRKLSADINVTKEVYCCIASYVILQHVNYARECLNKYFECNLAETKKIFDADTLKPLEELYYCVIHMNYLNTLCGAPYIPTKYHKTFNGTFIYKLLRKMSASDCEPNEFVQNFFASYDRVLDLINLYMKYYQELF